MTSARAILLALTFLAISLAKSASAAPDTDAAAPVTPDSDKPLRAGDTVSLEIVEDRALPIRKIISDTGELDAPYIGRVSAAGRTCAEVSAEIKKKLDALYYFNATVKLAIDQEKVAPSKVAVSGKVMTPGLVEIPFGQTLKLSEAIVKAGGGGEFGDLGRVRFTRKGKTSIINVRKILEKGAAGDVELQDGDSIFVPQKIFNFGPN